MPRMGGSAGSVTLVELNKLREELKKSENGKKKLGKKIGKLNVDFLQNRKQRKLKRKMIRDVDYTAW